MKAKQQSRKGITCGTAAGAKQGRTKGNGQRAEYENREGMHEKSGSRERGKRKKRKQRSSTETAAVRQEQEEQKGRNRRLSSRKQNGNGRKKVEVKRKIRKAKARSEHLRNSCGSESGKGEKKQTVSTSTRAVNENMRNQVRGSGEDVRGES